MLSCSALQSFASVFSSKKLASRHICVVPMPTATPEATMVAHPPVTLLLTKFSFFTNKLFTYPKQEAKKKGGITNNKFCTEPVQSISYWLFVFFYFLLCFTTLWHFVFYTPYSKAMAKLLIAVHHVAYLGVGRLHITTCDIVTKGILMVGSKHLTILLLFPFSF